MTRERLKKRIYRIHRLDQLKAEIAEERRLGVDVTSSEDRYRQMTEIHEALLSLEDALDRAGAK